jgi:hypothetical protein
MIYINIIRTFLIRKSSKIKFIKSHIILYFAYHTSVINNKNVGKSKFYYSKASCMILSYITTLPIQSHVVCKAGTAKVPRNYACKELYWFAH